MVLPCVAEHVFDGGGEGGVYGAGENYVARKGEAGPPGAVSAGPGMGQECVCAVEDVREEE